jgi:hypothetical protein
MLPVVFLIEPSFESGRRKKPNMTCLLFVVYTLFQIEIDVLTFITGCLVAGVSEKSTFKPDEPFAI